MSKLRDYACGRIEIAQSEPLTRRRGVREVVGLSSKRRVTEAVAKAPAEPANGRNIHQYVADAPGGPLQSDWPMPRADAIAPRLGKLGSIVQQFGRALFGGPASEPERTIPAELVTAADAPQWICDESHKRGFHFSPPGNVIFSWCDSTSPLSGFGLNRVYVWEPYTVCLRKETLLAILEAKRPYCPAWPAEPAKT